MPSRVGFLWDASSITSRSIDRSVGRSGLTTDTESASERTTERNQMDHCNDRRGGPDLPCASLDEALRHLRRPPAPEAVRFKIQNTAGDHAQVAAYIDARLVFDRLDLVCGGRGAGRFEELPSPLLPPPCDRDGQPLARPPIHVRCRLTAFGVTREDVGEGEDPKAAFSDAIKRAAVHFGVGRALYAMRAPWLRAGEAGGELRRNRRGRLVLDERTEEWCRERYRAGSRSVAGGCSARSSSTATRRGRRGSRLGPGARSPSPARPRPVRGPRRRWRTSRSAPSRRNRPPSATPAPRPMTGSSSPAASAR